MKENNKINTKGNWFIHNRHLRTNFDPDNPATSSNRRIRKAMRDRGTKILDRFTWTVATSPDLDPLRTDNVLRAFALFTSIVADRRYEGVITRQMPGFLHALTTDPVATANQIIDYQNGYWIDPECQFKRLEGIWSAGRTLNDKSIVVWLETISSVFGTLVFNKLVKNQGLMIVRKQE